MDRDALYPRRFNDLSPPSSLPSHKCNETCLRFLLAWPFAIRALTIADMSSNPGIFYSTGFTVVAGSFAVSALPSAITSIAEKHLASAPGFFELVFGGDPPWWMIGVITTKNVHCGNLVVITREGPACIPVVHCPFRSAHWNFWAISVNVRIERLLLDGTILMQPRRNLNRLTAISYHFFSLNATVKFDFPANPLQIVLCQKCHFYNCSYQGCSVPWCASKLLL